MKAPSTPPNADDRRPGVDWAGAYARLATARSQVEGSGSATPDEVRGLLRRRAEQLARPLPDRDQGNIAEFVTFAIGERQYGIAVSHLVEVVPEHGVTPVPCVPAFMSGVVNHRGRIVAILDGASMFGVRAAAERTAGRILIVDAAGVRFGIRIAGDARLTRVTSTDLIAAPPTTSRTEDAFIRQATRSMVLLIDLEAVWRSGRFTVNEEVR